MDVISALYWFLLLLVFSAVSSSVYDSTGEHKYKVISSMLLFWALIFFVALVVSFFLGAPGALGL